MACHSESTSMSGHVPSCSSETSSSSSSSSLLVLVTKLRPVPPSTTAERSSTFSRCPADSSRRSIRCLSERAAAAIAVAALSCLDKHSAGSPTLVA
eukprot:CAMPEP_0119199116 /NCGR_PEP_ID=MMETSP1316-20130426/21590_1 /TAXON_ID=41880 /ORGANISM="Pycnococcus provasolii, Strain RCC2336" /LENGTH=95 /DNA_ID=CAMNT_0007195103 /DNA_START=189 /DNA_END=476 /DNA_ORIENTATION=-